MLLVSQFRFVFTLVLLSTTHSKFEPLATRAIKFDDWKPVKRLVGRTLEVHQSSTESRDDLQLLYKMFN